MACKALRSAADGGCALPPTSGCRSAQPKRLLLARLLQRSVSSRPVDAQLVAHCGLQVCPAQACCLSALQGTMAPSSWMLHDLLPAMLFSAPQREGARFCSSCLCLLQALHCSSHAPFPDLSGLFVPTILVYVLLLQALYRGNSAQVLRILPDTLIKFMVNDTLKVMFAPPDGRPIGITGKLAAGTATGMLKCVMVYPLDLARTRMAAGERFRSLSVAQRHGRDCSSRTGCLL